jgi:molecular chaperone DnaK
MTITGGSALPKDEIDRMMREAEEHAEEDKVRREEAEVRNQAEALVFQTEKFLKDNDEKLPDEPKERVKASITKVNEALKGTDIAAVKSAVEELANESQQLGTALYANAQADAGAAGGDGFTAAGSAGMDGAAGDTAGSGSADEDIVDAEIVEDEPK